MNPTALRHRYARAVMGVSRRLASRLRRRGYHSQRIVEVLWPFRRALALVSLEGLVVDAQGASYLCESTDLINLKLMLVGAHEFEVTDWLGRNLLEQDVFLDVGANLGYFSVLAGVRARSGRVVAFEPSPDSLRSLRANVALNSLSNVRGSGGLECFRRTASDP